MVPTKRIWFDGKFVNWDDAKIHVLTHALHYGYALFEGIRCNSTPEGPAIFRLNEHIDRLFDGARVYKMRLPYTKEQLIGACLDLVKENDLKECYVRPIVFSAQGEMGVNPLKNPVMGAIGCWEWGAYLGEEGMEKGIRCTVSSWARIDSRILPPQAKCSANYANSILAKTDALAAGYDEAILLTLEGYVAEGSGENIFRVKNGEVYTPTMESGILGGITRASVIQIARDNGIVVHEEDFTREGLFTADELFFSGTAANVTPIREVDGRSIGSGQFPVTKKIQQVYLDAIHGRVEKYRPWLSYVR
ncbi:MAG: branched-chain amino acid transaminase [Thaumarchaeota archaeon]|nr:branched-chain amino acid transaminase [Nitrososphaerota archaeon]